MLQFVCEETGAETSEIALVLGLLVVAAAAAWQVLRGAIQSRVQEAASSIGGG